MMQTEINPNDYRIWQKIDKDEAGIKKIKYLNTATWCDGWYKNPSSGRSSNFGVKTEAHDHFTVITKGGCFFTEEKCKVSLAKNSIFPEEIYGGISFEAAQREYDIALLIQERFNSLLGKKANCPQPIETRAIMYVLDKDRNENLVDFFVRKMGSGKSSAREFTRNNFINSAAKSKIDIFYPMSDGVSKEIKDDPFRWLIGQYFEKNKQGVYQYKIDGPNTRIMDLMTLNLSDRRKYFIEANNAKNMHVALEKFTSNLGEFYALLHKVGIGYHGGSSEHCTLIDTTIAGVIMDIGGLSEHSPEKHNLDHEEYMVQVMNTTNLLSYVCKYVLCVDESLSNKAWDTFLERYKNICWTGNLQFVSENKNSFFQAKKIRTQYVDSTTGNLIMLASDLKDLYSDQSE